MKKSMTYICIFLTIFLFNIIEVNAANAFTCIYDPMSDDVSGTLAEVQDSKNNKMIFFNETNNANANSEGWIKVKANLTYSGTIQPNRLESQNAGEDVYSSCGEYAKWENNKLVIGGKKSESASNYKLREQIAGSEAIKNYTFDGEGNGAATTGLKCADISDTDKWLSELSPYTGACLYVKDKDEGCSIVQMNMSSSETKFFVNESQLYGGTLGINQPTVEQETLSAQAIANNFVGDCPTFIRVKRTEGTASTSGALGSSSTQYIYYNINLTNSSDARYVLTAVQGNNIVTGEPLTVGPNVNMGFTKIDITSCEQLFGEGEDLLKMIKSGITVVKTLIPIGLIGLGIVDFASATFAGSEDKMKKAQIKFIKRLIIGVAIFVIPSVLKLLLTIASGIWSNIDPTLCGII